MMAAQDAFLGDPAVFWFCLGDFKVGGLRGGLSAGVRTGRLVEVGSNGNRLS